MENKFFMHRIKHDTTKEESASWDKGIEVKDTYEGAKQSYHAYLGAYAYGMKEEVDFVQCMITDKSGAVLMAETWKTTQPEPNA